MSKKILIATGGTGGHIYPAIALAQQLAREVADCQVLFVGGSLGENRYFDHSAFAYRTVDCGTFTRRSLLARLKSFFKIFKGIWQSHRIMREFQPDVAVGFGSYYAFPPLVAAKLMSIPVVLHEANSIPGKVNRYLSKWAAVTGVHFPETIHLLKGKVIEVGMPLRQGFCRSQTSCIEARHYFNLLQDRKTILVFGGSQGANAINNVVREALCEIDDPNSFQVLHVAGDPSIVQALQSHYKQKGIIACVKAFEDRMDLAWQAADMVICRSGAGTVAEQLEFEVPGILIPLPSAADNHQEHNADFMVAMVGGAVKLNENIVEGRLRSCLCEFLKDDCAVLSGMRQAMKNYKKRSRTRDLCALVKEWL